MRGIICLGAIFVLGGVLAGVMIPKYPDKVIAFGGGCGVGIMQIIPYVFLRYIYAKERARGKILVISLNDKRVSLPRVGRSWSTGDVVSWEVVSGVSGAGPGDL